MSNFSLPLTKLIHENLSIIMDFCFSRKPITELVTTQFLGEWKYLRKALFVMSEQRAGKAALELAVFMRLLDDREDISGYLNKVKNWSFGRLIFEKKPDQTLKMLDVANKIIHASGLEWDLSNAERISVPYSYKSFRHDCPNLCLSQERSGCRIKDDPKLREFWG